MVASSAVVQRNAMRAVRTKLQLVQPTGCGALVVHARLVAQRANGRMCLDELAERRRGALWRTRVQQLPHVLRHADRHHAAHTLLLLVVLEALLTAAHNL